MVRGNGGNQFRQYTGQNVGNQNGYDAVQNVRNQVVQNAVHNPGVQNVRNQIGLIVVSGIANQNIRCYNCRGLEVNANCILMANLQQASTLGTQSDKAPIYDSDGSAENDNNVISVVSNVEQSGGTVEQHPATAEETRALYDSLYNNLATKVETVNLVNRVFVSQKAKSRDELYFSNTSKMATVSKSISIPNEEFSNDTSPSVAQKFLNEEAVKFFRDFKSLAKEADESLAKHKALEFEIERLLRAVVSQDIMSIVQRNSVIDTSNLQTELDLYNDMQQKIERLQAQLGDLKHKSKDTPCKSDTLDSLSQKLENENVELEFQVLYNANENAHLKTTYKNLFDSINVTRAQTKTTTNSSQQKLHDTIYENAKLRAHLFDKVSEQKDITKGKSVNTKFANQSPERKPSLQSLRNNFVVRQPNAFQSGRQKFSKTRDPQKVDETNDLSNPVTSNSVPIPQESKVVKNDNVIAPGMFRINPSKTSREDKFMPINKV
ncbi:hypothetical protein Tco_1220107 [Tanacetum coccineum]